MGTRSARSTTNAHVGARARVCLPARHPISGKSAALSGAMRTCSNRPSGMSRCGQVCPGWTDGRRFRRRVLLRHGSTLGAGPRGRGPGGV